MSQKQIRWINAAKCLSALGVLVDHWYLVLYCNQSIAYCSYFAVGLFVFLSGLTSWMSNQRHQQESWGKSYWRSVRRLLQGYLIATFVQTLITMDGRFDLAVYMDAVVHFNGRLAYWFVAMYLQLMLLSRPLYRLIHRMEQLPGKGCLLAETGLMAALLAFALYSNRYTNMLNIYGGGGVMFGGSYVLFFAGGMLCARHQVFRTRGRVFHGSMTLVFAALLLVWWKVLCRSGSAITRMLLAGGRIDPPEVLIGLEVVLLIGLCFHGFNLLEQLRWKPVQLLCSSVDWVGRHCLSLYLYPFLPWWLQKEDMLMGPLKTLYYVPMCIVGALLMGLAVDWLLDKGKSLSAGGTNGDKER